MVVINGEGWCYVFDFSAGVGDAEAAAEAAEALAPDTESATIKPCHVQRIPANTKVLLLHDVNADGLVELVIGLTDRVVRTYQYAVDLGATRNDVQIRPWNFTVFFLHAQMDVRQAFGSEQVGIRQPDRHGDHQRHG